MEKVINIIGGYKYGTRLWARLIGTVLMKELGFSVETSDMENTSRRPRRTESPLSLIQVRLPVPATV